MTLSTASPRPPLLPLQTENIILQLQEDAGENEAGEMSHQEKNDLLFFWPLYCGVFFFCFVTFSWISLVAGNEKTGH